MYRLLFSAVALVAAVPAQADVEVSFWAYEAGIELPHTFFNVKGTVRGKPVTGSYGYTPVSITPAILWGPVPGRIDLTDAPFIAKSTEMFRLRASDEAYDGLMALVQKYRTKPGSIYYMNSHNCVTFVGEAAQIAGLKVVFDRKLIKKPVLFLKSVVAMNANYPTLRTAR